jgi:O-antigen/teichoic acid export membrane protein
MKLFCITYALWPIHTANLQAINAMGRSDIYLKLEILKKILGLAILAISLIWGIYGLAIGEVIASIISSFINAYPNKRLLLYGYGEQVKDILPSLALSLLMGVVVSILSILPFSPLVTMGIQVLTGALVYIGLAALFRMECFFYLIETLTSLKKHHDSD